MDTLSELAKKYLALCEKIDNTSHIVLLHGSKRDILLAQEIRARKLDELVIAAKSEEEGKQYFEEAAQYFFSSGITVRASFWIKNKEKPAFEFIDFIKKQQVLLSEYQVAERNGNTKMVEKIADEYNTFIADWRWR